VGSPDRQSTGPAVLIAEDDEMVAAQLRINLELIGVTDISVAGNGRDALALMNEGGSEIDIIFCDLNMPEMDGIELMNSLAEQSHLAKIVLISGGDKGVLYGSAKIARNRGLDVLGVLEKPVDVDQLKELIDQFRNPAAQGDF
jgi:YesN/AraC family two-component response regulator